jgi:hypothetical protein
MYCEGSKSILMIELPTVISHPSTSLSWYGTISFGYHLVLTWKVLSEKLMIILTLIHYCEIHK